MRLRPVVLLGLAAACAVATVAGAAPRARVVATQTGIVRQVVQSDRYIVWTRCLGPDGPTEVWAARRGGGKALRVKGIRTRGACDPVTVVGAYRDRVVTLITGNSGLRRLDAVEIRTGRRHLLEAETTAASGVRITGADVEGPRIAWQRDVGAGDGRVSETLVGDLRAADVDGFAGAPRRVVYRRSLQWTPVVPTGVWVAPNGSVAVREAIRGALYGYGDGGHDRVTVVTPGRGLRTLARPGDGFHISGADLSNRYFAYTLTRTSSGRVWMYATDRVTGRRRVVRRLTRPAQLPEASPAVPVATVSGTRMAWRERLRVRRGYVDRVVSRSLRDRKVRLVARIDDTRGQRRFVTAPALLGRRVAWASVALPLSGGVRGGYYGVAPAGAQSQVLTAVVR